MARYNNLSKNDQLWIRILDQFSLLFAKPLYLYNRVVQLVQLSTWSEDNPSFCTVQEIDLFKQNNLKTIANYNRDDRVQNFWY